MRVAGVLFLYAALAAGVFSAHQASEPGNGDAARGHVVFARRCAGCHALTEIREGPPLAGVYGRKAGSVPAFDYSAGLKNAGFLWNDATLNKWLTDPDLMVPDNRMGISVQKPEDRADLIAFLAIQK